MSAVTDQDVLFAQAVVALAREHGMTSISLEFRHNFELSLKTTSHERKRVQWSEGRHGDLSEIKFTVEASASFPERQDSHAEGGKV